MLGHIMVQFKAICSFEKWPACSAINWQIVFTLTPLFVSLEEASGSQKFAKNLVLPKIKAISTGIGRKLLIA